ncbi:hypothetical protein PMZ80_005104 [Knufia obscura]|uniref:DUF423-domain-containing protein n=1 Tax=Knufia obscura TaxID=1635080 RepID=A0ABR0RPM8_9EURO|nr:hypothetical protein PMZ80_005104 [Knufia obscura]
MSSFDENIAELRAITDDQVEEDIPTPIQHDPGFEPLIQRPPYRNPASAPPPETIAPSPAAPQAYSPAMAPLLFTLSTTYGATSVALGAFGAHGLKKRISDPARITNWSTAAQYQLIHSVALLATSLALPQRTARIPGALWVAGMTMFSGSIYLLVLDPVRFRALGPVTPLGGLCLIGGWVGLGIVGRRFVPLR